RKAIKTTVPDPASQKEPDLLDRDFTVAAGVIQLARPQTI
ncbi:Mycobacterium terramassiliense ORFan, partial [Mycobacterium terramassiliense]